MITRSRKLSLKLVYQLTHKTMICRSKCRPLNRSSIGTNRCQAPKWRTPDQNGFGAQRESLQDIASAPDAAIHQYGNPSGHRVHHAGQRVERGYGTVQLAPAVV